MSDYKIERGQRQTDGGEWQPSYSTLCLGQHTAKIIFNNDTAAFFMIDAAPSELAESLLITNQNSIHIDGNDSIEKLKELHQLIGATIEEYESQRGES